MEMRSLTPRRLCVTSDRATALSSALQALRCRSACRLALAAGRNASLPRCGTPPPPFPQVNAMALLHLLDFGSGFDPLLLPKTGRGAFAGRSPCP